MTTSPSGVTSPYFAGGQLVPEPGDDFVLTPRVQEVTERALAYLDAGYPVHLAGPSGTGKTTLAFHIAAQRGRPVSLVHGNDDFSSQDLVGRDSGYRKSTMVDNFISSVLKTEESMSVAWTDNRLTTACERGHTLVYDEFNRSRPETNNVLLSVLEEGILDVPRTNGDGYVRVHDEFRVILTSNPAEYAGVHRTQDALLDRLITIEVGHHDAATETRITATRSGLSDGDAAVIVELGRILRQGDPRGWQPTIRACIALGDVLARTGRTADPEDPFFRSVAWDIFGSYLKVLEPSADEQRLAEIVRGLHHGVESPAPSVVAPAPVTVAPAAPVVPPAAAPGTASASPRGGRRTRARRLAG